MKNLILSCIVLLGFMPQQLYSQQFTRCYTDQHYNNYIAKHPEDAYKMDLTNEQIKSYLSTHYFEQNAEASIEVPIVVHVIYNTPQENISQAQIESQIHRLNKDYNRLNADTSNTPGPFKHLGGSLGIHFYLAQKDPQNQPTNGIIRKYTNHSLFGTNDDLKFSYSGGDDAWPTDKYLNIWICNFNNKLLGYAQYPKIGRDSTDGLAINYKAFGDIAEDDGSFTLFNTYDKGRTTTHELGHWLGLFHIWGDSYCGSDSVNDTPTAEQANLGCPVFPHTTACPGQGQNGEMFSNFMDYSDDACMNIFTKGQVLRMWATFNLYRADFIMGIDNEPKRKNIKAEIYPNPSKGSFYIDAPQLASQTINLKIFNSMGKQLYSKRNIKYKHRLPLKLNIESGLYFLQIISQNTNALIVKKINIIN